MQFLIIIIRALSDSSEDSDLPDVSVTSSKSIAKTLYRTKKLLGKIHVSFHSVKLDVIVIIATFSKNLE